ncbi:MAG: peptidoglycan DD-metalloendopeptidase family protein [Lachnospiraceae bacterium]
MKSIIKKAFITILVGVLLVIAVEPQMVEAASEHYENNFPLPVNSSTRYGVTVLGHYSGGSRHSTYLYTYGPLKGQTEDLNIVVDIAAAKGIPIYAVASGTIYINDKTNGSGNYLVIAHDDGTYSYYGHMLNKSSYSVGTRVSAGTIIGNVGMSGSATGYHLHFEWSGHDPYCEYSDLGYLYTISGSGAAVFPHNHSSVPAPVEWSNLSHSNVTENTAFLSVDICKIGSVSKVGYYLGTSETNMSQICSWSVGRNLSYCTCQIGGESNESNIALQPNTTYYYKAFVTDTYGVNWYSETRSFQTLSNDISTSGNAQNQVNDLTKPTVSNVQITDVTSEGYTISCMITDDNDISSVYFPTFTEFNGCDDIADSWPQQTSRDGNTYSYRVRYSDHNYEEGNYWTYIYAYDSSGNYAVTSIKVNVILQYAISFDNVAVSNLTSTTAFVKADVTADATQLSQVGLQWGTTPDVSDGILSWEVGNYLSFISVIFDGTEGPELNPGTTYYYRFYALRKDGVYEFDLLRSFTTPR